MKIKSKPIGEWTVRELAEICDNHDCGHCPIKDICDMRICTLPVEFMLDADLGIE